MAVVACKAMAPVIHCEIQRPRLGSPESSGRPGQVVPRSRRYTLKSDNEKRGHHGGAVIMRGVMAKMMRSKRRRRYDHREINGGDHHDEIVDLNLEYDPEEELENLLENLYESIEMSKKSYHFEIIAGRLAMILFAMTMSIELATGDSILKIVDTQEIAEGLLGCLAATTCATFFSRSSVTRNKIQHIFTISCNAFFDALIDNMLDGFFPDNDPDEPSDNNFN